MKPKVLIIDDDVKLNELLTKFLGDFGFDIISATLPSKGLALLQKKNPDIIILDIMLPEMDGFEVCRTVRKSSNIPIIMLTARGELTDKVVGLELGADDYLPKPFEPRELVARIHSILRRADTKPVEEIFNYGSLQVNGPKHNATLDEIALDLTTNEFAALKLLVSNPGIVLDRDRILQTLRGIDCDAFNRSVDITMSRLRQKLGDNPKDPKYIKTIWGTGYMFIPTPQDA